MMPEKDKKPEHSKLADIERLRLQRYMTKGAGAKHPKPAAPLPTLQQLRDKVSKVPVKIAKRKKNRTRR